jgi:hypothetical protein
MNAPLFSAVFAPCDLCRRIVQMGPIFEGRYLERHESIVCNGCWEEDRNGYRTEHESSLAMGQIGRH